MESRRECTWILGLSGFRVVAMDEGASGRLVIRIERRGVRRYACNGCGRRTGRVRSRRDRTWDDLPWVAHHVTLVYQQRRLLCRHCGIRVERIEFANPKARVTRRLRQQIGVDCQVDAGGEPAGQVAARQLSIRPERGSKRLVYDGDLNPAIRSSSLTRPDIAEATTSRK